MKRALLTMIAVLVLCAPMARAQMDQGKNDGPGSHMDEQMDEKGGPGGPMGEQKDEKGGPGGGGPVGMHERMEGRMEEHMKKMFDQLGLSDEQKKLIEANKQKNREARKSIREEIKANMKAMGEEMKKPDLDMVKINALHETQKQLMGKMADERFQSILQVRQILTKEQFAKFAEMMEKKMQQRHGRGVGKWGMDKEGDGAQP